MGRFSLPEDVLDFDEDDDDDIGDDDEFLDDDADADGDLADAREDAEEAEEAEDDVEEPATPRRLVLPATVALEPFTREAVSADEVTTPNGLLFELRAFMGKQPIAYDPCSCPWSPTRALHANMLKQYRTALMQLSTDPVQQNRYKYNFPGKVSFGDGLARPFPAEGLTYVFPGFKAGKTQQWLKKVRSESLQQRSDPDRPRIVQNGNELPFAGEIIMLVSLEHAGRPWFDYVWAADALCFLRETLWFGGDDARSKHGCVLVYYGYRRGRFRRSFSGAGRVVRRCDVKYTGPRSLAIHKSAPDAPERLVRVRKE